MQSTADSQITGFVGSRSSSIAQFTMDSQMTTFLGSSSPSKIRFEKPWHQSKLVSNFIHVPEMKTVWWVEVIPANGCSSFSLAIPSPPDFKVFIRLNDHEEVITSKLLKAIIDLRVDKVDGYYGGINHIIFKSYEVIIDNSRFEISTLLDEYQASESRKTIDSIYNGEESMKTYRGSSSPPWNAEIRKSFDFICSIQFSYLGKYGHYLKKTNKMEPSYTVPPECERLNNLFLNGKFHDFTFFVEGSKMQAHKCILSRESEVFDFMFTYGLEETNSITVDCDRMVFYFFLSFIYTKIWTVEKIEKMSFDLYKLADRYKVSELKDICLAFILIKEIDCNNALELYEFAETYKISDLTDSTWEFITKNMLPSQSDTSKYYFLSSGKLSSSILRELVERHRPRMNKNQKAMK